MYLWLFYSASVHIGEMFVPGENQHTLRKKKKRSLEKEQTCCAEFGMNVTKVMYKPFEIKHFFSRWKVEELKIISLNGLCLLKYWILKRHSPILPTIKSVRIKLHYYLLITLLLVQTLLAYIYCKVRGNRVKIDTVFTGFGDRVCRGLVTTRVPASMATTFRRFFCDVTGPVSDIVHTNCCRNDSDIASCLTKPRSECFIFLPNSHSLTHVHMWRPVSLRAV